MEDKIKEDLKQSQLNRDELTTSTLRMLLSELNYFRIQKGAELDEVDIFSVVQRELKKRKEAALGFRSGKREEAAEKEEKEAEILKKYLPEQLSDEELTKIVKESINNIGARSMSEMGKVIGMVMSKVGSNAEGSRVSQIVKEELATKI